jgi:hypothetical protein
MEKLYNPIGHLYNISFQIINRGKNYLFYISDEFAKNPILSHYVERRIPVSLNNYTSSEPPGKSLPLTT